MIRPLLAAAVSLFLVDIARSQISFGGEPLSFSRQLRIAAPTELMPRVDVGALIAEDEAQRGKLAPFRFGENLSVEFTLDNSGVWESFQNGDRLWRLRIHSPNAITLNVLFDAFWLPPGATLFAYNDDHSVVLGEFNEANNATHGMFAIEPIRGDAITLEYYEPHAAAAGVLRISEVIHGYRDPYGSALGSPHAMAAGACEVDVNCPLGANWQDVKHSVARVILGGSLCTGSMINDLANDGRQYFLTANHCYGGNPAQWIFQFNFEAPTCGAGGGTTQSVSGSVLKSRSATGDNCLVEIVPAIPTSYNVYLEGWDRSPVAPTSATCIHHPQGDVKKISSESATVLADSTAGGSWHITAWDNGVTEPGSSGAPLYDQNQHLVGQFYGGASYCGSPFDDYFGRLDASWNTGLNHYLDPSITSGTSVDGRYLSLPPPQIYCTAKVNGQLCVPEIAFNGNASASNALPFTISASLLINQKNGVLFYGTHSDASPFQGGFLCVQSPVTRTYAQNTGGSASGIDCSGTLTFDFNQLIQIGVDPNLVVGTQVYAQYWSRDPHDWDGYGTSLSDAISFVINP